MTHGSLFSGIGGFDLAAQWMEWENVFHCEKDKFCQKVLKKHFPNSTLHTDIKELDGTIYRRQIDILTGGFPCQPFSLAGKRKGVDDARHLWPENLRIIKEIQPPWVVGENVYGIANWNKGLVFEMVCADLEAEGYEVQPVILPACSQNANHRRDRVWFIAYSDAKQREREAFGLQPVIKGGNNISLSDLTNGNGNGQHGSYGEDEKHTSKGRFHAQHDTIPLYGNITDTQRIGRRELELQRKEAIRQMCGSTFEAWNTHWKSWPVEPTIHRDHDGIPNRVDRIKSLGNAIVPQVAYEIFNIIEQMQQLLRA